MISRYLTIVIALALCSCSNSFLTVQTDYLSHKNLASYFVGTPDPRQNCPTIGQRLIISWSIPKMYLCNEDLHLEVTIRFRNREELFEIFNITRSHGTYVYALLNEDFVSKRGILTYKIDLVGGDCIIEEWRHQIWADLIEISHEQSPIPTEADIDLDIDWDG